jgi:NAD(P)-dependent dehydrogenase (short-subunit alcohol dehydrogenase family)
MTRVLENRYAIITGASVGLGFEIAKKYLEAGASLMICARNEMLLDKAALALRPLAGTGQSVLALPADISPHFKKAARGKIIQLSGGGATSPLPGLSAYAASKAAVIRFVETLAEETRPHHIDVNAIAPGALNTRMLDEFLAAGPERIGLAFYERSLRQKKNGGAPLGKGADLAVFLGSPLSDGITGKLISAVWDPWEALPNHLEDLNGTDIYTLRRIVPRDRGMAWGDGD